MIFFEEIHLFNTDRLRLCLNLIAEKNTLIQEEIDLIEALAILHQYEVSILPLQGTII